MDCSFVVSVFFIVLLLNTGLQTDGQILTLCKDPLLSSRCTLQCSREAANESVRLYKWNTLKKDCNGNDICSKSDTIYADTSNAKAVKFNILKLSYADRGDWRCISGDRSGEYKELQVYSFKDENVAYDIRAMGSGRYNLTVKIECVMPIPTIVVKFCDEEVCRGNGNAFFNGPCAYSAIETHRKFSCILDFKYRDLRCHRGIKEAEPLQLSIMLDNREVYATETNEVFKYVNTPTWQVLNNGSNSTETSSIPPCTRGQTECSYVTYQAMIITVVAILLFSAVIFVIVVYLKSRYVKGRGYIVRKENEKESYPLQKSGEGNSAAETNDVVYDMNSIGPYPEN